MRATERQMMDQYPTKDYHQILPLYSRPRRNATRSISGGGASSSNGNKNASNAKVVNRSLSSSSSSPACGVFGDLNDSVHCMVEKFNKVKVIPVVPHSASQTTTASVAAASASAAALGCNTNSGETPLLLYNYANNNNQKLYQSSTAAAAAHNVTPVKGILKKTHSCDQLPMNFFNRSRKTTEMVTMINTNKNKDLHLLCQPQSDRDNGLNMHGDCEIIPGPLSPMDRQSRAKSLNEMELLRLKSQRETLVAPSLMATSLEDNDQDDSSNQDSTDEIARSASLSFFMENLLPKQGRQDSLPSLVTDNALRPAARSIIFKSRVRRSNKRLFSLDLEDILKDVCDDNQEEEDSLYSSSATLFDDTMMNLQKGRPPRQPQRAGAQDSLLFLKSNNSNYNEEACNRSSTSIEYLLGSSLDNIDTSPMDIDTAPVNSAITNPISRPLMTKTTTTAVVSPPQQQRRTTEPLAALDTLPSCPRRLSADSPSITASILPTVVEGTRSSSCSELVFGNVRRSTRSSGGTAGAKLNLSAMMGGNDCVPIRPMRQASSDMENIIADCKDFDDFGDDDDDTTDEYDEFGDDMPSLDNRNKSNSMNNNSDSFSNSRSSRTMMMFMMK